MSLILEALRKSEAERRRGQAPDVFTELPPAARRRDARLSPLLWLGLAVIVLLGGAWLLRGWVAPSLQNGDAAIDPGSGTTPSEPMRRAATQDAVDSIRYATPPVAARVDGASTAPTTAAPVGPLPPPAPPSGQTGPGDTITAPDPIAASSASAPGRNLPDRVTATPGSDSMAPSPAPPVMSAEPIKLADLTAEQRRQLPPLRMSMHMWDQDPARRFVIIDGARHAEGDRIGPAVVEQISADGVLLDWNGVRLRVSMR